MKNFLNILTEGKYTGIALFGLMAMSGVLGRITDRITVTAEGLDNQIIELITGLIIIFTGVFVIWILLLFVIYVTLRDLGVVTTRERLKPPRKRKK